MNATPKQYSRVATAMGFSPMAKANLAEVHRIATRFGAEMFVFHVGEWTEKCQKTFESFLSDLGIDAASITLKSKVGDPKVELLSLCNENDIDLLALGALIRENMFKVFSASIARDVCRKAKVSLLLLTHSSIMEKPCERIVVNGLDHPKTPDTIATAVWTGNKLGSSELVVVDELSEKSIARADDDMSTLQRIRQSRQLEKQEHNRIESVLGLCTGGCSMDISEQHVYGKKGYTIAHYAKAKKADLLVVNSPDTKLGILDRIFKHDLEYILADLPTDVLIVHTTKHKAHA
jgi:nucleotide-binding universal stress UspA family protein